MKLLNQYYDKWEAEKTAEKLRKRGILTFISSRHANSFSGVSTGAVKVGLWVVLDKQYSDAEKIITGKQCKVKSPLTESQMQSLEKNGKVVFDRLLIKVFEKTMLIFMIFLAVSFLFYIVLNIFLFK